MSVSGYQVFMDCQYAAEDYNIRMALFVVSEIDFGQIKVLFKPVQKSSKTPGVFQE